MKKVIILIFAIVLLVSLFTAAKLFIIGEPADGDTLAIRVEEGDGQLAIYIETTDSTMAISNMQYRYEGTVMHLTVWKVLSTPLNHDTDKCLYYEITDETEIWVGGKLIWEA